MRISIGLGCLTLTAMLMAHTLGLVPDAQSATREGRRKLCEAVAIQCCLAAQRSDVPTMRTVITALAKRNPSVLSAAVRRQDGRLVADAGDHPRKWADSQTELETGSAAEVPIYQGKLRWGTVEVRFAPLSSGRFAMLLSPAARLIVFVAGLGFIGYTWYLRRVLKHLDPSTVIPDRVRTTLDALAEGVLVLDRDQRIVLANKAFARYTGRSCEDLQGCKAPDIEWSVPLGGGAREEYPWLAAIRDGVSQTGVMIDMRSPGDGVRKLVVNTTPILGENGRQRGALATFDDVTSIERKNVQLEEMLSVLQRSRDEIHRQNEELQTLAARDPLTGCLNRRAFRTQFESLWSTARAHNHALSCVMVDIDRFKSINDNHGHAVGDQVLQQVAAILRGTVRDGDLVCRYGGEEFCILLPCTQLDEAIGMAERVRRQLMDQKCANLNITASLGVSAMSLGAEEPRDLLEQADKSLYASKQNGRNRVTSWADVPENFRVDDGHGARAVHDAEPNVPIPFHAVTALTSALAYRDTLTAEHSRRVADLCVLTARGLMSERECYVLEVAALLHDIGKLGVPDAILLKPGPLNEDEWKIMSTHDRIGVEIIMAAFSSRELTDIVRTHHAWYAGNPREPSLPCGDAIPLRSRILTIADAYDAMVSDRVYRRGRARGMAFAELRSCAGEQFDPLLVERFIEAVTSDDQSRLQSVAPVTKQTALRIGVQIERLAGALDSQDFPNLSAMAGRLAATAANDGVPEIATLASQLERTAAQDPDLMAIVELTTNLLNLCRSTQSSYLSSDEPLDHDAEPWVAAPATDGSPHED